jgi:hypothetical protein
MSAETPVAAVAETSSVVASEAVMASVVAVVAEPMVDWVDKKGRRNVAGSSMSVEDWSCAVGRRSVVAVRSGLKAPHLVCNNIILRCKAVVFMREPLGERRRAVG